MKKKGFFGGSFDPIHFGHLNLAVSMLEKHRLDEILFCPASLSPFKGGMPPHVSKEHRREMVRLAIAPFPQFQLLDWELETEGPSYTIDTIKALIHRSREEASPCQYHLILGEDALSRLHLWKDVEELIALAPPYTGSRSGSHLATMPPLSNNALEVLSQGITPIPLMEMSSTWIRERLSQKKTCHHLIPTNVLDMIERNRLYS
ncbi:MAG: nicotinate (nicotinamide) nucleotide adenylyltransferase [Rhabdochlamydiaceae bacterium]|nr:nicotinate (nicotinamide) nucleotide adenylyltransferase [Rhabdochlamydiaceae bacterium]